MKKLHEKKIEFYSHPEQNSKSFKVILSGLPQVDTKCIEESLKEHTHVMFNTQSQMKLYLLHFDAEIVNKKTLDAVKYVYHHVVIWLPYKPKHKSPTQCMRCLMYGHGILSCNRYTVCMLCAGDHLTKDCKTHNNNSKDNTNVVYTCFNCRSANLPHTHKANDASCPFRLKYEQARTNARNKTSNIRQKANNNNNNNQRTQQNTNRLPNVTRQTNNTSSARTSYADTMRTATASTSRTQFNTTTTSSKQSQSTANPNDSLWSFDECANILFDSIEKLQSCTSKMEQLKVIANLLKHACK